MSNNAFVIDVQGIHKSFAGKPAVINVSLQVKKGEIYGFLGPNGSGKTTTIRMICGLLTPDSGSGQCLGFDVINDSVHIKQHVGYMTQRFSLYEDLSIYENLDFTARLYGITQRRQRVINSIERLGLQHRQKQLAGSLSGGWKQRLALAAALLHDPELLLLDEPTAGVDPQARRDFWDQVHRLSLEGITTLVSTHYMDEAERCTRLAYIAYGHLLTQGTAQEIIAQSKLTTWEIKGQDVLNLRDSLQQMPGVTQVVAFGNALHVSGVETGVLQKTIDQLSKTLQAREIAASLEDVFIHLVSGTEDVREA